MPDSATNDRFVAFMEAKNVKPRPEEQRYLDLKDQWTSLK